MKLLPSLSSPILFYCSSLRSQGFETLPLLLWHLAGGERKVGLLCPVGRSGAHHRSPATVAIFGAAGVLVAFSIVVAAGQTRIKVPPLLLLLAPPTKFPPLCLLLWCLTSGERKVGQSPSPCVYYDILSVVYCARMDARRPRCRSFAAVAIAGATGVLVAFFIMVAAGFLAPSPSSFCSV